MKTNLYSTTVFPNRIRLLALLVSCCCHVHRHGALASSPVPSPPMILRVRRPDGSVERVVVESRDEPLSRVLQTVCKNRSNDADDNDEKKKKEGKIVLVNSQGSTVDDTLSIQQLGLGHGALLTMKQQSSAGSSNGLAQKQKKKQQRQGTGTATATVQKQQQQPRRWNPFPDLAKDYDAALANYKRRQGRSNRNSFSEIADLQSQLHIVEPQPDAPLKRVYLCRTCAERFLVQQQQQQASQATKSKRTGKNNEASLPATPAVWLLGVMARERVDNAGKGKRRPKTSLSSTTEAQEYCHAAHVHAMWAEEEGASSPSSSSSSSTATTTCASFFLPEKVEHVAAWLGLQCVGWMFSYAEEREEGVPVHGRNVIEGAQRQTANMKHLLEQQQKPASDPSLCSAFITLAMNAHSGATEAFQLSNICVQMVAEDLLQTQSTSTNSGTGDGGRILTTTHPILVDGKETNELDSLLCLVHTALLSREGDYAGQQVAQANNNKPVVKKNGALTAKTRKAIAAAVNSDDPDRLFGLLCDFQLLVALYDILGPTDCQKLCACVKKWTRQKRGTTLDQQVKDHLKQVVEG